MKQLTGKSNSLLHNSFKKPFSHIAVGFGNGPLIIQGTFFCEYVNTEII